MKDKLSPSTVLGLEVETIHSVNKRAADLQERGTRRGAGKARFNVATPTNATVTCTAYVLLYNLQTKSI